ncbi:hypothetical protein PR002_g7737 [Phytophthora rubi]|uniref:Uncharacterized protein n=1 Tax=Phytophthora rubi TaxID=129364 RepID=A0A6A3N484_9STRA|nr:hypothetical protein PR002_g7737 [Phytophthora rubi]
MKKRPKLRTKKSLNSDAWKSSDLPNLFRNVDHKRARGTEERVVSTKREKLEISTLGVVETKSRAQVATNKAAAVKVARSRPVKTEEVECKFRGCKMPVLSDGFCQKHERRERCKEKGCGHLATSKGRESSATVYPSFGPGRVKSKHQASSHEGFSSTTNLTPPRVRLKTRHSGIANLESLYFTARKPHTVTGPALL